MAEANVETVAKALNVTPRRVQQLVQEGMPKATRGVYDLGACLVWYIRYLQAALERRADPDSKEDAAELMRERARLAKEQADKTALENAETRGDIGRLSVWQAELENFLTEIRSALLSMPSKEAPQLNGDTQQRRKRLEEAVHEILRRLAAYQPSRRTSRDKAGDEESGGSTAAAADADGVSVGRRKAKTQ